MPVCRFSLKYCLLIAMGSSVALAPSLLCAQDTQPTTPPPTPAPTPAPAPSEPQTVQPVPVPAPETREPALHASVPDATPPAPAPPVEVHKPKPIRPFSAVAIELKAGFSQGFGAELAVPLAQKFNLRGGGSFFQYNGSYNIDGMPTTGEVRLRSATASLDWFPFNNRFHISPGVTIYNGNQIHATVLVPGGTTFSLGPVDYSSSPTDPVHGTADLAFGKRTAPNLTIGFGNMIPRTGHHFSMTSEFGFQYIGPPLLTLNLLGSTCTSINTNTNCSSAATDPNVQANLRQEEADVDNTIRFLRFYPIVSTGVSYRF
jgi:hypothetical protein